jgi:hypothetical protein
LTLMDVAKPWMAVSPAPVTCHSEAGLPGWVFSQATLLTIGAHGPAAFAAGTAKTDSAAARRAIITAETVGRTIRRFKRTGADFTVDSRVGRDHSETGHGVCTALACQGRRQVGVLLLSAIQLFQSRRRNNHSDCPRQSGT